MTPFSWLYGTGEVEHCDMCDADYPAGQEEKHWRVVCPSEAASIRRRQEYALQHAVEPSAPAPRGSFAGWMFGRVA